MDKRGISPIIATFILIAFAVSLGAVVMSYGSAYYEDTVKKAVPNMELSCNNAGLMITFSENIPEVCRIGNRIRYVIYNSGSVPISSVQVWASGEKIYVTELKDVSIMPAYPYKGEFEFNPSNGVPKTVKFIPKIIDETTQKPVVCFDKSADISNIREC